MSTKNLGERCLPTGTCVDPAPTRLHIERGVFLQEVDFVGSGDPVTTVYLFRINVLGFWEPAVGLEEDCSPYTFLFSCQLLDSAPVHEVKQGPPAACMWSADVQVEVLGVGASLNGAVTFTQPPCP